MDGIHDLGGRHGFGGSLAVRDEATFHDDWERRVFGLAIALTARGCFPVDAFRHAIERIDPVTYLAAGYWGRWLAAVSLLVDEGRTVPGQVSNPTAAREVGRAPRFAVGDAVRTRNLHPAGHTRMPGYARGKRGTVVVVQGGWVLPDTNAHGAGEQPEHVYAVRFTAAELWADAAEPATSVHLDCFERYLEPA
jgi:nitrile hydratase